MTKSMNKRVALVTGASGDIGSAIAQRLAEQGARVAIHYNSNRAVAEMLKNKSVFQKHGVSIFQADLTQENEVAEMWKLVESEMGPIDTLVCNAGSLKEESTPFQDMSLGQWQTTLDRNVLPCFLCMREFFRALRQTFCPNPSAVLVTSMSGVWGQPYHCDYAAAKAGVIGFSKSMAREVASRGITVNVVAPGFIDTDMTKVLSDEQKEAIFKDVPANRLGAPEEIAGTVAFLASDVAAYITGETIHVNGGMYMG